MKLIDNAAQLWYRFSSVQLLLAAAVFDAAALASTIAGELLPWGWRLGLGLLAIACTLGAAVARLVVQDGVRALDARLTSEKAG